MIRYKMLRPRKRHPFGQEKIEVASAIQKS
jgi:hypothetical protein